MKYFKLDSSSRIKDVGDFPQIQKFKNGYDYGRRESCSQISRYFFGKKPDIEIDFDGLELSKKAKLTDNLSASYLNELTGLLVSKNLYDFFSSLRTAEYLIYSTSIYQNGSILSKDYKYLHYIRSYPEMINYAASAFFLNHSDVNYKNIQINSFAEYDHENEKSRYIIKAKKLVSRKEMANEFDVLRIGLVVNAHTYITDGIKDEMVAKGFTGMTYKAADFLVVE